MRNKKNLFSFVLSVLIVFSSTGLASAAAIADCELTVYWDTLAVTPAIGAIGWEYIGLNSEATINQPESNPEYQHSQSPWQSDPLVWTLGNNTANLSSKPTHLISHTTSSSSGNSDQNGWINGNNHRGMSIGLEANTTYTFSIDYHIAINLSRENADQENASNYAQVSLQLRNGSPSGDQLEYVADPFSSNFESGLLDYSLSNDGTICLVVTTLTEGTAWSDESDLDRYWFETHLHTSTSSSSTYINVVPIPGAVWLLGSGLVGLVGFRKKLKK